MIIVSQEKSKIVNYNNITRIKINMYNGVFYMQCDFINGAYETLGIYKTRERAEEILQEIINLFKEQQMLHIRKSSLNNLDELSEPKYILQPVYRPKIYEMPEE